jgi:eukaryotic-like serine/threonine-protein kinase
MIASRFTQSQSKSKSTSEVRLVEVLDAYLAAAEDGVAPTREELLAKHPDMAEDLEACLASLEFIRQASLTNPPLVPDAKPVGANEGEAGIGDLGDFWLIAEVGRGGMGVVYEAVQRSLNRRVALKVLPFAAAMDPTQLRRFQTEALAAAQLHHTHIVPVYSVGCERGVHYYAMQFIEGRTLAQAISERRRVEEPPPVRRGASPSPPEEKMAEGQMRGDCPAVTPDRRSPIPNYSPTPHKPTNSAPSSRSREFFRTVATLGIQAAEALDHAHKVGIVHRDIKPANLLLDIHGNLWVTDFGLARLSDDAGLTITGDLLGTLRYMSPEQALAKRGYLDHRTDIYSLGTTLYELLTLRPAIDGQDRQELLRKIAQDEPSPLRRINPAIPRELETILLKAMSKEPGSRYDTAQELADDLRHFLEHRPIKARRPTLAERAAKWARRHRPLVASAVVMAILAAAGLEAALVLIGREHAEAVRQHAQNRHHRYVADVRQAYEMVQNGQGREVLELVNKWRPAPGEPDERNFAWYYLRRLSHDERLTLHGHKDAVYHAEFSRDGRTLVSCGKDGTVRFWEVATGRPLGTIRAHDTEVNSAAFSPDGQTLATAGDDGQVRLWDVGTGELRGTIPAHQGDAGVRFALDGRTLISGGSQDHWIKLWDVATLKLQNSKNVGGRGLYHVALSPGGRTLATADGDDYARLWNFPDLTLRKSLHVQHAVYGLAFSADGTRLATSDAGGHVRMWDLPSGEPREGFQGFAHVDDAQAVAFLDGDRMLVSADGHGVLRLSDATTGTSLATLNGHTGKIWGISVSRDDTTFATVSSDGTVKLWDARLPRRWRAIPAENAAGGALGFTPDSQTLIVAHFVGRKPFAPSDPLDLAMSGYDMKTGARRFDRVLERGKKCYPTWLSLSADGALALFTRLDGTATAWNVATGKRLATTDTLAGLVLGGAGIIGCSSEGGPIELVDAVTGQRRALKGTESTHYVASTPDSHVIVLASEEMLTIWDLATNRARRTRHGVKTAWTAATLARDATILATGATTPRGVIQLWDVNTLELLDSLPGHSNNVADLDFSPDGKVLASLSGDGVVKLWDVAARTELLTLRGPFRPNPTLRFTRDGRTLAFRAEADGKGWVYLVQTALPEDLTAEEGP